MTDEDLERRAQEIIAYRPVELASRVHTLVAEIRRLKSERQHLRELARDYRQAMEADIGPPAGKLAALLMAVEK